MGNSKSHRSQRSALISIATEDNWYSNVTNKMPSFRNDPDDPEYENELISINELVDSVPGFGNSIIRSKSKLSVKEQQKEFEIYLQADDDIWHKLICKQNYKKADEIVEFILKSMYMWIWLGLLFILALMCRFIKQMQILQPVPAALASIWMLLHIFTLNTKMTWKMLKSWTFWFKMWNLIIAIISYVMLYEPPLQYEAMNWVFFILLVAMLSLHDAWRLKSSIKIIIGIMSWGMMVLAYLFVYFNGNCYFVCGDNWKFERKDLNLFNEKISYKSLCLGGLQNLVIFVGKQLYGKIKHDKHKASVYSTAPKIKWVQREHVGVCNVV